MRFFLYALECVVVAIIATAAAAAAMELMSSPGVLLFCL